MGENPVYLETWSVGATYPVEIRNDADRVVAQGHPDRTQLIAAAPALVRALLACEWAYVEWDEGSCGPQCQGCSSNQPTMYAKHDPCCPVDAALTAAGLPDQASRDEARRCIAESWR
jgi:hypothetical protein